ncbi:MAG: MarR family winged helix-turn-helix transcriptional regulator [Promethearchaeota archaeon]
MTKPKIHVAILGKQETIEHLAIRRSIDELIIVYPYETHEIADELITRFSNHGIPIKPVIVVPNDFSTTLSSILVALNQKEFDECQIEFSITSEHCILTLAACVAAAITKASVICATGTELIDITEVWPSELVNLSLKKHEILDYLERLSTPISQKEISQNTGIRPSGVSRHLRDLEQAGYIRRNRVARKKQVQITDLGSAILHHKQLRKRRIWCSHMYRTSEGVHMVG